MKLELVDVNIQYTTLETLKLSQSGDALYTHTCMCVYLKFHQNNFS